MSNKGFITPLDTGLTKDSTYPNWVKIRPYGNKKRCKELEIKARGLLQKLIDDSKRLGLEHEVNQRRYPQSDGSLIIVYYHYENPVIDIFAPSGKGKKARASLFQCDLYQDHPDTPEDLTTQTITPIYFNVVDIPYWKEIPERQGNMEWRGDENMISFDGTQNWSRGIVNKKAWNDALYGPNGEDVGWPYNPRPEHAYRGGEITTICDNYPLSNETLTEQALFQLNFKLVFEPNDEFVFKQYCFINGVKYSPNFPFSNQYIMGGCLHRTNTATLCVLITQGFYVASPNTGYSYAYEDVWYFNLADGINATPIKILTMYYTNPQEYIYESNKSHITSWAFNKDGTIGKALRTQQHFLKKPVTDWGPWNDPRFIDLTLTYIGDTVTAEYTSDSSVPEHVAEIVAGGVELTNEQNEDRLDYYWDWVNNMTAQFNFPKESYGQFNVLDSNWSEDGFHAFGSYGVFQTFGEDHDISQSVTSHSKISHNDKLIWSRDCNGHFSRTLFDEATNHVEDIHSYNNSGLAYIGGNPRFNIAFFIKVSVNPNKDSGIGVDHNSKNHIPPNESCTDFPKTMRIQLICIFKGTEVDIGSPVVYNVPFNSDEERANVGHEINAFYPRNAYELGTGPLSCYALPTINGSAMSTMWNGFIPNYGHPTIGDFGGSIKISPDGSHCVISCSYMDIAKYIYPWHRFSHDVNTTTKVNRTDSMDALGVDAELQTAWNKYMINYAIIGPIPEEGDGTDSPTWALDGISLGGTGGSSPTIAGINSGSGSGSADFEGTGLDVRVEQLSRLLFNKKVTEDLPGGSSDNHSDYEFGIKEKDTNAFLPIGLYAFPSNEE